MNIYLLIVINIVWIILLFYPRFCKKQLWKTIISVGHPLFLWLYFIIGFGFFTATPKEGEFIRLLIGMSLWMYIFVKTVAFIWNLTDVILALSRLLKGDRYYRKEFCRCIIQLIVFVVTFLFLPI